MGSFLISLICLATIILLLSVYLLKQSRVKEKLKESESRLRQIIDLVPHFIFAKDSKGRFILANKTLADRLGTTVDRLIGKTDADFFSSNEEVQYHEEQDRRVIETGEPLFLPEERLLDPDGNVLIVQIMKIPFKVAGTKEPAVLGVVTDLTRSRQTEEALHESEEKFRTIYENAPIMISSFDKEGKCLLWNKECERIFGWTREEIVAKDDPLAEIYPQPGIKQHFLKKMSEADRKFGDLEWKARTKDGSIRIQKWADFRLPKGEQINVGYDITEHKRTEEALRESEAKFRTSVETLIDGFGIFSAIRDDDGNIVDFRYEYINEAGCKLNQRSREEQLDHTILGLLPRHKETGLVEEYARVVETGQPLIRESFIYEDIYGGGKRLSRALDFRAAKLGDGFAVTWRDVTDRKQAEEALRESEEEFRELFNKANDAIVLWELGENGMPGHCIKANEAACRMLGYSRDELSTMSPEDIDTEESAQKIPAVMKEMLRRGQVTFEMTNLSKDGRRIPVEVSAHIFTLGKKRVILSITRDITERKLAEERQKLTTQMLELLNQPGEKIHTIRDILLLLKEHTGFEAVGLRLREGEDFPYYETIGFSANFVEAERYLCARDQAGELARDSEGNPLIECMCGNIICGRIDPSLPFFSEGGSFWTNSTTDFLASTTEEDRRARARNRCNREGYESVALIPLHTGSEIIGLLQLNDHRKGMIAPEMIRFLEGIGASIGIALNRKRAEESLRKSEERFRQMAENIGEAYWMEDVENTEIIYINPAYERVYGLSPEILSKNPQAWLEIVHPDDREPLISIIENEFTEKKKAEYRIIKPDHSLRWIQSRISPIKNEREEVYRLVGIAEDITDRKLAEEALIESEKRYRTLFEDSPISLLEEDYSKVKKHIESLRSSGIDDFRKYFEDNPEEVVNCAGMVKITDVNKSTLELYEAKSIEDFREGLKTVFNEESLVGFKEGLIAFAEGKTSFEIDTVDQTLQGGKKYIFLRVSVCPGYEASLSKVITTVVDLTEKKRTEEQARFQQRQLIQADKLASLGTLVAGVAHEINNPNQAIMGTSQLMIEAWESIKRILERYYEEKGDFLVGGVEYSDFRGLATNYYSGILECSRRIDGIVNDLKEFSRYEQQEIISPVNINLVVKSALSLVSNMVRKSMIKLKVEPGPDLPVVNANFQRLEQVVINLIQNACQALTGDKKGLFVSTLYDKESRHLIIKIRDEGVGIPLEDIPRIKDPFFTTKRESGGTGLGLSVSASIIEEHNGILEFDSEPGIGTTAIVKLPCELPKYGG